MAKVGGRQKGTPNVLSSTAKENIQAVFVRLGSTAAMAEWANENKTEFYKIYSRLLPHEIQGQGKDGALVITWQEKS